MGKPMLAYAIDAALESKLFDEVMVSTDDAEIAEVAKTHGAAVPFMRSAATANDFATTADVLNEVIGEYAKLGVMFDEFCCIYPCVPFLTGELLREAHMAFAESAADSLMPVVKYSFPIQRAVRRTAEGCLEFREPENAQKRSQDLEPMYHDVGMFYFYKSKTFGKVGKVAMFEMPEEHIQDIDTMEDWKMAELKYKVMNG